MTALDRLRVLARRALGVPGPTDIEQLRSDLAALAAAVDQLQADANRLAELQRSDVEQLTIDVTAAQSVIAEHTAHLDRLLSDPRL